MKKNKIISMFSEGSTQSTIARIMRKNYNTIHSLIYREGKKAKKRIEKRIERIKEKKAKVISIDEKWLTPQIKDLRTYEKARRKGKRKSKWIWTASIEIEGGGIKYIYEVGERDEGTLMRLMEKLPESEEYETDGYVVYENIERRKHKVKKYERVNRNEGLHSRLRDIVRV